MIEFTQGDTATLSMIAQDGNGNTINLTGASFSTQIKGNDPGMIAVIPNSQHTPDPDQINNTGQFTMQLLQTDSQACGIGAGKDILTQITIGSTIVFYRGVGILTVLAPVPLQ
jgi:hypothetical protein